MTAHSTGFAAIPRATWGAALSAPLVSPDSDGTLGAVGALIGADTIDIIRMDERGRSIEPLAGWSRNEQPADDRAAFLAEALSGVAGVGRSTHAAGVDRSPFVVELARRDSIPVFLVVQCADPARRAEAASNLLPLLPILRQVFVLKTRLIEAERKTAAAMAAIDQDKCGVVAIAADGRPVVMNEAAADLLAQAKVVQLAHGVVRPTHYADAIRFHAALDSVTRRGPPFHLRRNATIMLLKGDGAGASLVVSVTPLSKGTRQTRDETIAVIHLFRPAVTVGGLAAVCRLFGLSPAEATLAGQLYRGQTVAESATAMRIKVDTARSYLKQIFAKTDTHRQADLLALLYQFSSVVRGNHEYSAI